MKSVFLKYVSALMTVWYCLSIIGFDVHSCSTTGNTFVNSILSGVTCEDIHPEHDCCSHSSCCSKHKSHEEDDDCCTNEIEVLDSEGLSYSNDDVSVILAASSELVFIEHDYSIMLHADVADASYKPDSGVLRRPDIQAVLKIWRI